MSVSDIVAINQDGKVSWHYCDSVGFTQIPGFLPENPLKNAEMAVEDDYGMRTLECTEEDVLPL